MPAPRSYHCEGLTLKKSTLGEADLLITLFTREQGKVRAVARGARRSTSKLVGHLEPLTQGRFSMSTGKSLDYINQVQIIESFAGIKGDLEGWHVRALACLGRPGSKSCRRCTPENRRRAIPWPNE